MLHTFMIRKFNFENVKIAYDYDINLILNEERQLLSCGSKVVCNYKLFL